MVNILLAQMDRGGQQRCETGMFVANQFKQDVCISNHSGKISVETARLKACYRFLDKPYDSLFFLDSDMFPPYDTIERLHKHNLDVVSANYPILLESGIKSAAFTDKVPHGYREVGLKEVDSIGLGACLIKRHVIENVMKHSKAKCFSLTHDDRGHIKDGEDVIFCNYLRELGIKIHVDFDIECDHFNTVSLRKMYGFNTRPNC